MLAAFVKSLMGLITGVTPTLAGSLDGLNTMSRNDYSSEM